MHERLAKQDPAVDLELLLQHLAGDRDVLIELAGILLDSLDAQLAELVTSITAREFERARRIAHGLRGSVANFTTGPA